MLSRTTARAASLSVSAGSANSSNHFFFFKNSQLLGLNNNLSYAASNPVSNFVSITWNNNTSRMSRMNSFTTRATAQPLKNADELIDSVETFIFDCDGETTLFFDLLFHLWLLVLFSLPRHETQIDLIEGAFGAHCLNRG